MYKATTFMTDSVFIPYANVMPSAMDFLRDIRPTVTPPLVPNLMGTSYILNI